MLSQVRFLHFADAHINNDTSGRMVELDGGQIVPFRVSDILKNFDQMIDNAIDYGIDYVFFAGDMYYNHLPNNLYRSLIGARLQKLVNANVKIILIIGNHDCSKREHAFLELKSWGAKNLFVVDHPSRLEFDDLVVTAIPWQFDEFTYTPQLHPTKPNVAIAHCTLNEALLNNSQDAGEVSLGREFKLPLSYFDGFDYVALGHIHKQQAWGNVVYPGSMELLTWGEFNDGSTHGYVLGTIGKSWTLHPYQTRTRYDLEITEHTKLPPVDPNAMYRITFVDKERPKEDIIKHFKSAIDLKIRDFTRKPKRTYRITLDKLSEVDHTTIIAAYFDEIGIPFDEELRKLWTEIQDTTDF